MDSLPTFAAHFVVDELIPTLAALALAAAREPLTWGAIGAAALPALWRQRRRDGARAPRR